MTSANTAAAPPKEEARNSTLDIENLSIFKSALEAAPIVAVQAFDEQGIIHFWNGTCEKLFGRPAREVVGKKRVQDVFFEGAEIDEFESLLREVYKTGRAPAPQEWPVRTASGDPLWLYSAMFPVVVQGTVKGVFCMDVDITHHKIMELDLKHSERRFHDIVESMSDWIWEVDRNGVYTFCSGSVSEILGYAPEEMIGKAPFDFMTDEEREKTKQKFDEIVSKKGKIVDLVNWCKSKDGRPVCLLTNGTPILGRGGELTGYRGVDSDITGRRTAEETLKDKIVEMERFTKLAVNRELKMIELKNRISELEEKLQRLGGKNT